MKVTVVFVVFGLFLTWLQPSEGQRDDKGSVRIPPKISSIFPQDYYTPAPPTDGLKVIHKCDKYSGTPPPDIYWQYYKNGVFKDRLYPNQTSADRTYSNGQLKLKVINPDEQYQCVAHNMYGTALSTKITVHEARGANFDRNVKKNAYTYDKNVGQPLLIPCKYTSPGIPDDIFFWKYQEDADQASTNVKLEDRIFVTKNGSLAFAYLKKSDGSKTYSCNVEVEILNTVKYGSWTKINVLGNAAVSESPTTLIYHTPNNTVAKYGESFKVQCIFGGNPVPTIQWDRPPSSRSSSKSYTNNNNELIIQLMSEEDEGFYKCTSKQAFSTPKTVSFFIDVKGPPVWVQKPASTIIAQGQKGVFHCSARPLKGEKPLSHPVWYRNGKRLNIPLGGVVGKTELSSDGKTLTIHNAMKQDDICNYQCSVSNEEGEIFADAAFNVILNTEVLEAPKTRTIDRGEVVMFDIDARTDPLKEEYLKYTWILNGRKIEFLDLFDIYLLNNNSLVVNTTGMDENRFQVVLGNYSVNISNGVEVVTRFASLMRNPVKGPIVQEAGMDLRWIALIVAVVLLFIIFILLLCVLFNRHGGDDYSVDKKERKAGHDPEKELADSGFHDLPRTDDDPDRQKPDNVSISSTAKSMGSETDSMEEYSDADAGSRFNEDGSFIGAYQGHESKGNVSNV